jgi:hypothetical protein
MTEPSSAVPKRPMAVNLIGALLVLIAISYIAQAVAGLSYQDLISSALSNVLTTQGSLTPQAQTALENVLDLLRGGVALIVMVGFFRLRRWAWVTAVAWSALGLLNQLFRVFSGEPTYFWMLLEVVAIFALTQVDVQKTFGIKRDEHDTLTASLNSIDRQ